MYNKIGLFKETDKMSSLVSEYYDILLIINRFGISLGFEDKCIKRVCCENNCDTHTFLTVVNMILANPDIKYEPDLDLVDLPTLIRYLLASHSYYLEFRLPNIRKNLEEAIAETNEGLKISIIKYFDEYVDEVRKHLAYEENRVFPYVNSLIDNKPNVNGYNIDIFSKAHGNIEDKLNEFKNIIIKYYPEKNTNKLNLVLFEILNCSHDLTNHHIVENDLFIPMIRKFEKMQAQNGGEL
ncbi:MAG: hemerythrin domain-containing protein [Bacteroidales bacterium]